MCNKIVYSLKKDVGLKTDHVYYILIKIKID